ncbi:DNA recombination protein RmuC [Brevibacillus sp. SYP-B805]|uniref:DNA recombination protein RmuC n=1 Tax=Brevibacillus sp. SYP-B805 TaxID=1578199 RepID=UPI0013EA4CB3|nr:DNA recombination protein RmuC [Brevibacillus sp. SYP-B805]NGQ93634.1 DNA recombination protein RmuC [Brevibacillus sp. SYP-B805]
MDNIWLIGSLACNLVALLLVAWLLVRKTGPSLGKWEQRFAVLEKGLERVERAIREEMAHSRQESGAAAKQNREEMQQAFATMNRTLMANIGEMATQQKHLLDSFASQLAELTRLNEQKLGQLRETIEQRLAYLQEENGKKLEQMRQTVDEKLHATLEQRLGESFKLVSERLELVHKGLGEMQTLASGVGDLKRVLSNVKTRGTLGEIQLGNLLEQMMSPEQYEQNVATKKGSKERVEFAVKLPAGEEQGGHIWLPIDSKFPLEDYQRLLDAQEEGNPQLAQEAAKQLEARIKAEARAIREKYVEPPYTTDFAIMFLPIEGLFAEVLRRTGLWETLQREFRVVVTGPTTLTALLNSLQMGFRTLAIQKRSSEVWQLLGAVKGEFGKFADILAKTQKKLQEASNTIESAAVRTRAIERRLRTVQELPAEEAGKLLPELDPVLPEAY